MSASIDYTGRTVDILIFQGVVETGKQPIQTGFGEAGFVCTGIQKVAQTWLALFMTDRGTVLNKPTRGTGFLTAVRLGRIQVAGDIPAEFALAADLVRQTMELDSSEAPELQDDERLDDAELLDFGAVLIATVGGVFDLQLMLLNGLIGLMVFGASQEDFVEAILKAKYETG